MTDNNVSYFFGFLYKSGVYNSKIIKNSYTQSSQRDKYPISLFLLYYYCIWEVLGRKIFWEVQNTKQIFLTQEVSVPWIVGIWESRWCKQNVCIYTGIFFFAWSLLADEVLEGSWMSTWMSNCSLMSMSSAMNLTLNVYSVKCFYTFI